MEQTQLKIIILEDSEADAELIQRLLLKHHPGACFQVMMSGEAFVEALHQFKPDVIISDNAMPQFSASAALAITQQQAPHTPFILVTGTVSEEFAVNILKQGADDYLLKDRLTRLPDAIITAIKNKQAAQEQLEIIERLRKSEERYRTMMSRVTDGFVSVDKNGLYTYVNQKAAQMLSQRPSDMIGKNIWEVFKDAVGLPFYHAFYEAVNRQRYVTVTNYYYNAQLWIEHHLYPSADGVSIFFRDITEQKKAAETVRQSEEKYRLLIERMSDSFIELDKDFCYTYVNRRYAELANVKPYELLGKSIWEVFPHAVGSSGYHMYHDVVKDQQYRFHTTYSPGVDLWHEDHVYPNGNGGLFAFVRDITEKKLAEQKLIQRERYFRALVENNEGIISLLDKGLNTIYCSESVSRITGWTTNEFELFGYNSLIHPDDREYMHQKLEEAFAQPAASVGICFRAIDKQQQLLWLEGVFTNMLDDDAVGGIITNLRDITERRQAEEKLKAQQAQLQTISDNLAGATLFQIEGEPGSIERINYISHGITELTGCTPQQVKENPLNLYKCLLSGELELLKEAHAKAQKAMQVFSIEVQCFNYRNEHRWLNIVSKPRRVDNERLVWDGFHIDITERKEADEKLKAANERFQLLARTTNDVIWDWDIASGSLWWNNSYHKLFGFESDPPPTVESWLMYIHPDDRERVWKSLQQVIDSSEDFWNHEYRLIAESGATAFVYDRGFVLRDEHGRAFRMIGAMLDFTERKKAEEAIRVSEEKYRTLVEQATDGIFIADHTGKFVMVNTSGCNMSGYSREELSDMTIYHLVHPESLAEKPFDFVTMRTPKGARSQRKMICKNGSVLDIEISAKFLSDNRFIAFIRDISERIKAEAAIKASEERYRVLVAEASEGIFISDATGRFITVNASACRISQYREEELLQMSIFDFFSEQEIREQPLQFDNLRSGKTVISERLMMRKDGKFILLEITSKMLTDGRLLSLVRDIAERKKAEEALMASEEKYRSLVEQASDAIFIADANGRFITVNPSGCKLSGFTEEQLMQMTIHDFAVEEDVKRQAFRFEELRQGKTTITERIMKVNGGKTTYVEITSKLLSDGRLLSFVRDISDRVKAQEKIKQTSEQLRRLTAHLQDIREEERKRIGREIHDELGQQLTAIKMDVAWINKQMPDNDGLIKTKLKNVIGLLDSSNQSIRRILSELRPNILDDHGLLEAMEWLNRQFVENTGADVVFTKCELPQPLPESINTGLFRIYQEALTNITKYANATSVISSIVIDNGIIELCIAENGQGFDVDSTGSKKSFGLLGMKERVLLLNGKFQLESSTGNGTRIHISIPLNIEKN